MADEHDDKPEFEVIRRAPPPEQGASPMMLGIAALVLVVVGAFFVLQSGSGEGDDADATPTPVETRPPDEPAPDFVWEKIDFRRDQGNLQGSLDAVEEALEDYPNAHALQARRESLLRELNPDGLADRPVGSLKSEAEQALAQRNYEDALDLIDAALQNDDEDADLYFMRGQCLGALGQKLEALSALEDAKSLGYDAAKADALIERYR